MTEFDDVISLLRENRPEASALELDQIKQRGHNLPVEPAARELDHNPIDRPQLVNCIELVHRHSPYLGETRTVGHI